MRVCTPSWWTTVALVGALGLTSAPRAARAQGACDPFTPLTPAERLIGATGNAIEWHNRVACLRPFSAANEARMEAELLQKGLLSEAQLAALTSLYGGRAVIKVHMPYEAVGEFIGDGWKTALNGDVTVHHNGEPITEEYLAHRAEKGRLLNVGDAASASIAYDVMSRDAAIGYGPVILVLKPEDIAGRTSLSLLEHSAYVTAAENLGVHGGPTVPELAQQVTPEELSALSFEEALQKYGPAGGYLRDVVTIENLPTALVYHRHGDPRPWIRTPELDAPPFLEGGVVPWTPNGTVITYENIARMAIPQTPEGDQLVEALRSGTYGGELGRVLGITGSEGAEIVRILNPAGRVTEIPLTRYLVKLPQLLR